MGQKIHPLGLRLGINKTWKSHWYVDPREYANTMLEDLKLRRVLYSHPLTRGADISDVEITRHPQRISLTIHTARPGVIIGAKGANIEKIGSMLQKEASKKIRIKIEEVKQPGVNAQLIAFNIARQLRTRTTFRRTLRMALVNAIKAGAQGVKIKIAGRLGGSEMARTITVKEGRIPLHTLRANIDYGFAESFTSFGTLGVKVWIFSGEIYRHAGKEDAGSVVRKRPRMIPAVSPNEAGMESKLERKHDTDTDLGS